MYPQPKPGIQHSQQLILIHPPPPPFLRHFLSLSHAFCFTHTLHFQACFHSFEGFRFTPYILQGKTILKTEKTSKISNLPRAFQDCSVNSRSSPWMKCYCIFFCSLDPRQCQPHVRETQKNLVSNLLY